MHLLLCRPGAPAAMQNKSEAWQLYAWPPLYHTTAAEILAASQKLMKISEVQSSSQNSREARAPAAESSQVHLSKPKEKNKAAWTQQKKNIK